MLGVHLLMGSHSLPSTCCYQARYGKSSVLTLLVRRRVSRSRTRLSTQRWGIISDDLAFTVRLMSRRTHKHAALVRIEIAVATMKSEGWRGTSNLLPGWYY